MEPFKSDKELAIQFQFKNYFIDHSSHIMYIIGKSLEVSYQLDQGFDIMINTPFL